MTPVHLKVDVMKQTSEGTSRAAGVKLNYAEIQVQDTGELSSERTETFTKALLSGLLHRRVKYCNLSEGREVGRHGLPAPFN